MRVFLLLLCLFSIGVNASVLVRDRIKIDATTTTTDDNVPLDIIAGDMFGYYIENIGDLDSDGVEDLAVSQYKNHFTARHTNKYTGRIMLLFMNADGSVKSSKSITQDDGINGVGAACVNGPGDSVESLAYLGNLINGNPTLAVGIPFNSGRSGKVIYIVELDTESGKEGDVLSCGRIAYGENGFNPGGSNSYFSFSLAATDVDDDGVMELIVNGGPALFTLFLNDNGSDGDLVRTFVTNTYADIGITAADDRAHSIRSVDGKRKLVVGDQDSDKSGGSVGSFHIVNLDANGAFESTTRFDGSSLAPNGSSFGSGVESLGDMDWDGVEDLLVSSEVTSNGQAYIVFLNSDDSVKKTQKISAVTESIREGLDPNDPSEALNFDSYFGHGVGLWRSSDFQLTVGIGAHEDDTEGTKAGAMYLFEIYRQGVCTTGEYVGLKNQTEIDNFQNNYGPCDTIPGQLRVSDAMAQDPNDPITNLNGLSDIVRIGSYFYLDNTTDLTSLAGMSNLEIIDGPFWFNANTGTPTLAGLTSLSHVGGHFFIQGNQNLLTLGLLPSLASVGNAFVVYTNPDITDLGDLPILLSVETKVDVRWNDSLADCSALGPLVDGIDDGAPGPGDPNGVMPDVGQNRALLVKNAFGCGSAREILHINNCTSALGIPVTECKALILLYYNTDGNSWINKSNWLTATAPWNGVTVENGAVTGLELARNNLVGAIPKELENLSNLEFLSLGDNELTGAIPAELGKLINLEYLDISSNKLYGGIPASFANLVALEVFIINNNILNADENGNVLIPDDLQSWFESILYFNISGQPIRPRDLVAIPTLGDAWLGLLILLVLGVGGAHVALRRRNSLNR